MPHIDDGGVQLVPTHYRYHFSQEEIDEFNRDYDCFVIPLADAFRPDFMNELRGYTQFIKQLKIPCYVIGAGVKAPYDVQSDFQFPYDKDVVEFIEAVLEKSSMVGLRGQITADYLGRLGFKEGQDYTVIGCPSMYTYPEVKIRDIYPGDITKDSKTSFSLSLAADNEMTSFVVKNASLFHEYYFIPQNITELKVMYAGVPKQGGTTDKLEDYPKKLADPLYLNGQARFFANATSWIDFEKQMDFAFGTRLHGTIVNVLAGTPSIIIPIDAREKELVDYHGLTYVDQSDIQADDTIFDLIERVDFHAPEKVQKRNFDHYLDFLNKNHIRHIYQSGETAMLDEAIKEVEIRDPLIPITQADPSDIAERLEKYSLYTKTKEKQSQETIKQLKKEVNKKESLRKELDKAKQINKQQAKQLSYKSVQTTLKVRKAVEKTGIVKALKRK